MGGEAGLHSLIAWSLAAFFVVYLPQFLIRPVWPLLVAWTQSLLPSTDPWFAALAVGSLGTNLGLVIFFNLALWPIYATGIADAYRCDASKPWPWSSTAAPEERASFWRTVLASLFVVSFNALIVAYGAIALIAPIARYLGSFSFAPEAFPSTAELLAHLTASLLIEDFMFYCTHRTLHCEPLYRHIHSWHHAFKSVIALSSENAHPVEYAVGNLAPVTLGPLLLRSHAFTFFFVRAAAALLRRPAQGLRCPDSLDSPLDAPHTCPHSR